MNKRLISLLLSLVVLLSVFRISAFAEDVQTGFDEVIILEDGSYIEVEIVESLARSTKTGSKTYTYKDSSGNAKWKATLDGTYAYDGATYSCTAATCSVAVYDDGWNLDTKYAYRSGDTAYASVTMCHMVLGVMVEKSTYKLTLTCDKNGNLS